jgi:trehalose-phosphatase
LHPDLRTTDTLPDALAAAESERFSPLSRFAIFLDYDGTLTPIVARPELAAPPDGMGALLESLAETCVVGIITGRDVDDLRSLFSPRGVWLAGSHGFDVRAPDGTRHSVEVGRRYVPALEAAADELDRAAAAIPGAWVERKAFAVAVHYRQVDDHLITALDDAVEQVAEQFSGLRRTGGKRVFELRPDVAWDKGRALWFLLDQTETNPSTVTPIYIGDDVTDEDAFAAIQESGVGIVVTEENRPTAATLRLATPDAVGVFLAQLAARERTS